MIQDMEKNDLIYLESIGIDKSNLASQVDFLSSKNKTEQLSLIRPCIVGDGITSKEEFQENVLIDNTDNVSLSRFIPASGYGTRMLQVDNHDQLFFKNLELLPFFNLITESCRKNNIDLDKIIKEKDVKQIKEILLAIFLDLPKALLPFHLINNLAVTPIEEIILYFNNDIANKGLVFAIQEEHEDKILKKLNKSDLLKDIDFDKFVNFTYQDVSTNSVCLDNENNILRNLNGDVYTHPSGHGALLENLNKIESDYVLINNIDNVSPKTRELRYEITKKLYKFIKEIRNKNKVLNKPIRVCGVIKDQTSKGGKPFWVFDGKETSVQIVEESQVYIKNTEQKKIWDSGIYFNPVEMICSFKDFEGKKLELSKFANMSLKMKTKKTILGKQVSFIETPGLWNGSMHNWNTTFVEIPEESFTPVKNFTDLFLPIHQP